MMKRLRYAMIVIAIVGAIGMFLFFYLPSRQAAISQNMPDPALQVLGQTWIWIVGLVGVCAIGFILSFFLGKKK